MNSYILQYTHFGHAISCTVTFIDQHLYLILLHHASDLIADFACIVGDREVGLFTEFVPADVGISRQLLLQTHTELLSI